MELKFSTWQEVETYLHKSKAIVLPIGSTEQHGPNGLIGTDALCPESLAVALGEKTGALIAPTISVGMAQHHLGFPGSITLRPTTLIAVIQDIVNSLIRHGFERFYFLNGHGGNVATAQAAFSEIYAQASMGSTPTDQSRVRCKLVNWWEVEGVMPLCKELFGDADGSHATCGEVSLTQYAYPDSIKAAEMDPPIAPTGPIYDAADYRRRFPDGRIGSNPSLASPEAGEKLFEQALTGLEKDYGEFAA
ncbi:MAG TPA: creatininase family protein [Woeseiaceae bacterium]|jgi:creatinine amidohydrolase|nr:creatininase family protein [Woeseiaceae bacterium]